MTDITRDLLISLCSHMAYMQGQLEALHQLDDPDDHYWFRESVALQQKVADHLAAMADGPAVPECREPASVVGQPSDEELLATLDKATAAFPPRHPEAEGLNASEYLLALKLRKARAVLGRWGNPAPTPAAGEVAELVAEIRHFLAGYQQMRGLDPEHIYSIHRGDKMEAHITVSRLTRAADLLERLSPPQPVPVSERPWEREEWCDPDGLCWLGSDALDGCTPTWLYGPPAWAERFPNVHRVLLPAHALPLPEVGE